MVTVYGPWGQKTRLDQTSKHYWHHILISLDLVLALSDAPGWCLEHNDLNFHDLYNLVINFFEDIHNLAKEAKQQDLLKW